MVTESDPANLYFRIGDGSDLDDGLSDPPIPGVAVMGLSLAPSDIPPVGRYVWVTGISTSIITEAHPFRLLLVRSGQDIRSPGTP